jgi:Tol biopolymer transport system component
MLTPGTRLGPYEITGSLGAGGMGEVYKARDTRLDRTVAIKVLPAHVANDPGVRARFEREARAISALDHPNICVLHDVGQERDTDYLVMQYLDGETLAARLSRGALPLDEAIGVAVGIAAALDRAHRAGIAHRDLKPGNVMLTKSGPKLLDFGLAKLKPADGVRLHPEHTAMSATLTSPLTGQGTILGTLLYMSPEQLEGRDVDARSDIFSFGAVLYEMVTGVKAFEGHSQASVIGAILEREPPPMAARAPLTPPALERLVGKCLAKDPDRRWQTASDLADELRWVAQSSRQVPVADPGLRRASGVSTGVMAAIAAVVVLVAAAIVAAVLLRPAATPSPVGRHLSVALPAGMRLVQGGLAVSPDGRTIVYVAATNAGAATDFMSGGNALESSRLYVRRFDSDQATVIPGTEGARAPFFSPDGLAVGYFTLRALMKVSLLGGAPIRIAGVPPVTRGATWANDDTIIYTPTQSQGLQRIAASGGADRTLTTPDIAKGDGAHLWPEMLPGGQHVLVTVRRGITMDLDRADIAVVHLQTGQVQVVLSGGGYARYSPTGHLLFVRGRTLMAVPFDLATRTVRGTAVPIVEQLLVDPWVGGAHFAVARDGTLLYARGELPVVSSTLVWVDRSGQAIPFKRTDTQELGGPRISPDGSRGLFFAMTPDGGGDIFVGDLRTGVLTRFTSDIGDDIGPIWTRDGRRIVWSSFKVGGQPTLTWRSADGVGAAESLLPASLAQFPGSASPAGVMAYTNIAAGSDNVADVFVVSLSEPRQPRPFVSSTAREFGPEFSPDGRWIAYSSNDSGKLEVYVAPYPGPGKTHRISQAGGVAAAWSRDGQELFYQSDAGMMVVALSAGSDLAPGEPRLLFKGPYFRTSTEDWPRLYDVAPDGKRFLMQRVEGEIGPPPSFNVMLDWVAEIAQRTKR